MEVEQRIHTTLCISAIIADVETPARPHVLSKPGWRLEDWTLQLFSILNRDSETLLIVVGELEGALVQPGVFTGYVHTLTVEAMEFVLGQNCFCELRHRLEVDFQKSGLVWGGCVLEF